MGMINFGSRRAVLKASVAMMAFAGAGGVLAACSEKPADPAATTPAADANPVVATKYGQVKGFTEDGVSVFKGVRYGADTSTNRFGPPAEPATLSPASARSRGVAGSGLHQLQLRAWKGGATTPTTIGDGY